MGMVLALGLMVLVLGCATDDPQNTFSTGGDVADDQADLFVLVAIPAAVVFVIVQAALVYALFRYRRRQEGEMPQQVHGNTRLEVAWTIAPAILLIGLAVPMVALIADLGSDPAEDALNIRVTGFQWAWQFEYLDPEFADADGNPLTVIGRPDSPAQLHIPVGREVGAEVVSIDVVHSFWVPRLAGKLDAIPGRTNRFFFNATETGSFAGQCAEFCGLQHADMKLVVIAETEEEFQQWANEMLAAAELGSDGPEVAAREG